MIVCDTGPLVAAADRDDDHNRACTDLFTALHLARRTILVPSPVVAEVGYLLGRTGGPRVESAFLRSVAAGTFTVVDLTTDDYSRAADLVDIYADFPLGTTDAAVVSVAERLHITEIATLDHRHFLAVRPQHINSSLCFPDRPSRSRITQLHVPQPLSWRCWTAGRPEGLRGDRDRLPEGRGGCAGRG